MVIDPYKMLERFEKKHGEYPELLNNMVDAEVEYQGYLDRGYQRSNIPSELQQRRRKTRGLYREHSNLIWMCQGFTHGYNMCKKEMENKSETVAG